MDPAHFITCPYCWQPVAVEVDPSATSGEFVEDCGVCCRPIAIRIRWRGEAVELTARREND